MAWPLMDFVEVLACSSLYCLAGWNWRGIETAGAHVAYGVIVTHDELLLDPLKRGPVFLTRSKSPPGPNAGAKA